MTKKFKMPEFLYHGTSYTSAKKALEEGLRPRALTKHSGNWEHTISSHPECVYLTTIYAPYFAATSSYLDDKWAMVEIDTSRLKTSLLRPDEDALEQGTRHLEDRFDGGLMTTIERTEYFREHIDDYRDSWKLTLQALGTCSYKGVIPPKAITRIAIYDPKIKKNGIITNDTFGASIILMNHRFCQEQYKNLTRWMFGETISLSEYRGSPGWEQLIPAEAVTEINEILNGKYGGRELIINKKAIKNSLTVTS